MTGKVARRDPASMQVKTPVGTIGIRGTMTAGTVGDSEALIVLLGPGPENNADEKAGGITVSNDKGSTEVDKDGWGVSIKAGEAPSAPFGSAPASSRASSPASARRRKATRRTTPPPATRPIPRPARARRGARTTPTTRSPRLDAAQGDTSRFASQQFGAPTTATWDEVRGIPGGTGKYSGSGAYYNCTGGTCATTPLGTTTFAMDIDFGARTVGGGVSNISLTSPASFSGTIGSQSYANMTGLATMPLSVTSGTGNFNGTSLKLLNTGGVTAGAATIDVRVISSLSIPPLYGGPVTGSLTTP